MRSYAGLTTLVVGLGSMGKRRVRNMRALGIGEILGYDVREDRRRETEEKYGIVALDRFQAGLDRSPDALIISTPPHKHLLYAWPALEAGVPFFMEANCFLEGMAELAEALRESTLLAAPSRTLWFHPGVQKVRELFSEGHLGRPAAFAHHCGHALPLWHPWEDYRQFYGGQADAKGAGWDMVGFELQALTYLFGNVKTLSAMFGKRSSFDTPIDDTFQILLEFEAGTLGSSMIDVISPYTYRTLRIISESAVITWDDSAKSVDIYDPASDQWTHYTQERGTIEPLYTAAEEMYIAELDAFFRAIQGRGTYPATFDDELQIVRLVEGVRESRDTLRHISC